VIDYLIDILRLEALFNDEIKTQKYSVENTIIQERDVRCDTTMTF